MHSRVALLMSEWDAAKVSPRVTATALAEHNRAERIAAEVDGTVALSIP